ncbi:MAG: HAD family hydrolase, partial [Anaerolineaceae bacterium]|nr:HAD family hydrolase [Anaerolineaceae bacterium]
MNRDEAYVLLTTYVTSDSLIKHMLSVEAAMVFYARKLGQDEQEWAMTGLLHDYDWEIHPNSETHPLEGLP